MTRASQNAGSRRGRGRGGGGPKRSNPQHMTEADMKNEKMEEYYKAQNILPDDEWDLHWNAFRRALPTTFRITGSLENAKMIRNYMNTKFLPEMQNLEHDGQKVPPPEVISWYPNDFAYKLDVHKNVVRKQAQFQKFQKFLVSETESGNIVRQEAVSMIPPLFMDIKSDSVCLDMCAAPGSKTSQMLEYLMNADPKQASTDQEGLIIANDSDFKRAYMLIHQTKRLNSPAFLVTNHDATFIANFHKSLDAEKVVKFDRILADVPCSGDATMRKNYNVWTDWSVKSGLSLHPTQVNCLRRGLHMLKVGGRLVYSTCSLNPIENEAVLNAVLGNIGGAAHLVDVSAMLPQLKRRPGMYTWKATDMDGTFIASIEDVDEKKRFRFPATIFAPTEEEAKALHLERAMRVYPHLQDTGGFFIAVIEKTKDIVVEAVSARYRPDLPSKEERRKEKREAYTQKTENLSSSDTLTPAAGLDGDTKISTKRINSESDSEAPDAKKSKMDIGDTNAQPDSATGQEQAEDALEPLPHEIDQTIGKDQQGKFIKSLNDEYFKFIPSDHPELLEICRYYDLSPAFCRDNFMSRNISAEPVRTIYYTSSLAKDVLIQNESRMKFVHGGIKIFSKQNIESLHDGTPAAQGMCKWRINGDAMDVLLPHISEEKKVACNLEELVLLMKHEYPRTTLFENETENNLAQTMKHKSYGCYVMKVDLGKESRSAIPEVLHIPIWKSKATIQLMLARKEREALYRRILGEDLPKAIKSDKQIEQDLANQTEPHIKPEILVEPESIRSTAIVDLITTEQGAEALQD